MKILRKNSCLLVSCICFIYVIAAPQQPEINDQYESTTTIVDITTITEEKPAKLEDNEIITPINDTESRRTNITIVQESVTQRICKVIARPFVNFIATPKVNSVLRNIGTCIVNGAMELITYYFPAPLIPLIATAAGMVIPFEPVVLLREKMPVTSYRRAFRTALNSFLSTFDRYRLDDEDADPYMTRRFNRRLMNDSGEKKELPGVEGGGNGIVKNKD